MSAKQEISLRGGIVALSDKAMNVRLGDYLDTTMIAELLDVQPQTIHVYRQRPAYDFPEPDAMVGTVPIWRRVRIAAWTRNYDTKHSRRRARVRDMSEPSDS